MVEITVVESMAGFSLVLGAEVLAVTGGENHQQDLGKSTSRANDLAASSVNNDPDASIFDNKYHDAIARHRRAALDGFLPGSARDSRNQGCSVASTPTVKAIFEDPNDFRFPQLDAGKKQVKDKLYVPHYLGCSTPWAHLFCSRDPGLSPTVREVAQNLHQIQAKDGELTEDEFLEMTYQNPSRVAEQAAYDGGFTVRKSITLEEQDRRETRDLDRLQDFISSLESPSEEVLAELYRILEGHIEWKPGYRLLLELDPQRSYFFNPDYRG